MTRGFFFYRTQCINATAIQTDGQTTYSGNNTALCTMRIAR